MNLIYNDSSLGCHLSYPVFFLLQCFLFVISLHGTSANCVWYDECFITDSFDGTQHGYNCFYNGSALPLKNKQAVEALREYCPSLAPKGQ